jgi:glycosyltransferase involved in cell wall biosynthesis
MTIGIAVPAYSRHIPNLFNLLDSLSNSTVVPDIVSISCSNTAQVPIQKEYPFYIHLVCDPGYKNPAQNRNIAASNLNTDIISFIDADDLAHPQRLEYVLYAFSKGCIAVVHDYHITPQIDPDFFKVSYQEPELMIDYFDVEGSIYPTSSKGTMQYHNAHLSVVKGVFDQFKYDERESVKYSEDSAYCNNLVRNGIKLSLLTNKLSNYVKI